MPILFANENLLKSSASQLKNGAVGEDFKEFAGDGSGVIRGYTPSSSREYIRFARFAELLNSKPVIGCDWPWYLTAARQNVRV